MPTPFDFKDDLASFLVRVILGLIFVLAGLAKAVDAQSFLITFEQFDLFPPPVILPAAILVIACEICLGLALLAGFQIRRAAGLLAVLLLSFIAVISFAVVRGKGVNCGCFGSMAPEQLGVGIIFRDILLIGGCLWLIARDNTIVTNN